MPVHVNVIVLIVAIKQTRNETNNRNNQSFTYRHLKVYQMKQSKFYTHDRVALGVLIWFTYVLLLLLYLIKVASYLYGSYTDYCLALQQNNLFDRYLITSN